MKTIEKNMVKQMRAIRDQLNKDFENMNYEEEKAYIKQELEKLKRKRKAAAKKAKSNQ